ncbi:MAG TPA: HAMP domain-containing sensor histidine kinase [Candidatus Binatia bacterium]|nr:HAMP domain-containing sensor histidine kinase [Candidatus Binatia bacterium]
MHLRRATGEPAPAPSLGRDWPDAGQDSVAEAENLRRVVAGRLRGAGIFFFVFGSAIATLELVYFPTRGGALLGACAAYALVYAAALVIVRRLPRWTLATAIGASLALSLCMAWYAAQIHNHAEMLALAFVLLLTGLVVMFPWGARGQLLASGGALGGYVLAVKGGVTGVSPIPYSFSALMAGVLLTTWGADALERGRTAARRRAAERRRAEEFSRALLDVARGLSTAISDPALLGRQIVERTRDATSADWSFLYGRGLDGTWHLSAVSAEVSDEVAAEMRAIASTPALARTFFAFLEQPAVDLIASVPGDERASVSVFARWGVAAVLSHALRRDGAVHGILGCCYASRAGAFTIRERDLLSAIANQATVALDNARLMEEARTANRLKSEFIATVSHELRTPLNVIMGYTDLLQEGLARNPGEQANMLARIRVQSSQLLDLIQAMLNVNRIEAGDVRLNVERFDVAALFDGLRASVPSQWCRDGVRLEWHADDAVPRLRTDRGKVEMILRNLIHNALKFTDAGSVTITASALPGVEAVQFVVSDTGSGIADEDLPGIFDMFRQGAAVPWRDGGVGLGLYIVKRLVEELSGEIGVESRRGGGARFTVVLPVQVRMHTEAA